MTSLWRHSRLNYYDLGPNFLTQCVELLPGEVWQVSKQNSQYFRSYLRKTTGGPFGPPSGARVKKIRKIKGIVVDMQPNCHGMSPIQHALILDLCPPPTPPPPPDSTIITRYQLSTARTCRRCCWSIGRTPGCCRSYPCLSVGIDVARHCRTPATSSPAEGTLWGNVTKYTTLALYLLTGGRCEQSRDKLTRTDLCRWRALQPQ